MSKDNDAINTNEHFSNIEIARAFEFLRIQSGKTCQQVRKHLENKTTKKFTEERIRKFELKGTHFDPKEIKLLPGFFGYDPTSAGIIAMVADAEISMRNKSGKTCDGVPLKKISWALQHLREESGRTQKDVATFLECAWSQIALFEANAEAGLGLDRVRLLPVFFGFNSKDTGLLDMVMAAEVIPKTSIEQRGEALKKLMQKHALNLNDFGRHKNLILGKHSMPSSYPILQRFGCEFWSGMLKKAGIDPVIKSTSELSPLLTEVRLFKPAISVRNYIRDKAANIDATDDELYTALRMAAHFFTDSDNNKSIPRSFLDFRNKIEELRDKNDLPTLLFSEALQHFLQETYKMRVGQKSL